MDKKELKKLKKRTPNILEIAATDKENLSSKIHKKNMNLNSPKASHAKKTKKIIDLDNRVATLIKNNKNRKDKSTQFVPVLKSDLTDDTPSDNYWKNLAESCRLALDTALKENVDLNNRVNELEYENIRLKAMLDEAKSLVEVLTEIIEKDDETNGNARSENRDSDSDPEDISFQSCA